MMGARVLDAELPVAKADRALAEPDAELRAALAGIVDGLVAAVESEQVAA